ncbi:hypothetical protein [Gemmiger sp.]
MKQKTKEILTALLMGILCAAVLSAVITVADMETARTDLMIGMQYETTGVDLDAAPGWLVGLVKLHQNFPLDSWAWGPAAAGLAALFYWVRRQRAARPGRVRRRCSSARHGCRGWRCSGPVPWIGIRGGRSPKCWASRR